MLILMVPDSTSFDVDLTPIEPIRSRAKNSSISVGDYRPASNLAPLKSAHLITLESMSIYLKNEKKNCKTLARRYMKNNEIVYTPVTRYTLNNDLFYNPVSRYTLNNGFC